jgi:hypothetical protein
MSTRNDPVRHSHIPPVEVYTVRAIDGAHEEPLPWITLRGSVSRPRQAQNSSLLEYVLSSPLHRPSWWYPGNPRDVPGHSTLV